MALNVKMNTVTLSKMVLHASRWSHSSINGVLVGSCSDSGKETNEVDVVDAIPLFHQQLGLTPMLTVALSQIEQRFKHQNLQIVGYYQANEHIKDSEEDFIAKKVTEKIAENFDSSLLVTIDNSKISLQLDRAPVIVSHLTHDGKWRRNDKINLIVEEKALASLSELLQRRLYHEIIDFDVHFDDITCDWANTHINKLLQTFL